MQRLAWRLAGQTHMHMAAAGPSGPPGNAHHSLVPRKSGRARCSGVGAGMYPAKRTARIAVTSERAFETLERGWSRRSPGSIDDRRALAFGCRASHLPFCGGGNLPPSSSSSETTWS